MTQLPLQEKMVFASCAQRGPLIFDISWVAVERGKLLFNRGPPIY
jgi:hypothetical protein